MAGYLAAVAGVRQQQAEATRRRVLATARRLFGDQGYFSTGTNEIVEAAGVGTRGALYHHFADKEALFRAVFEDVEADLGAKAGMAITGKTWFERLGQGLHAFLDASLDGEVRRIILIDGPAVLGWDVWRAIEAQHGLGAIEHMLSEGTRDGSVSASDRVRSRICCCRWSTKRRCSSRTPRTRSWHGQRRAGAGDSCSARVGDRRDRA